jgi:hydrogen peroxide-dependent heme synthase
MPDESSSSTYTAFWLYRLDPEWRRLPASKQQSGKQEFLTALEKRAPEIVLRGAYSLVGLRHDADLLLWVHGPSLDDIQRLAVALNHTGLGLYLSTPYTYVGVVGDARYDPEHRPSFLRGFAPLNYLSVYPFVKTPDWYLLPYERRRELMAAHGRLGRRYTVPRPTAEPAEAAGTGGAQTAVATAVAAETATSGSILTNTVDAFGLGDYEFIVAFESNDPSAITKMIEDLRTAEVRRYTKLDTPIFLGRLGAPADVLADL